MTTETIASSSAQRAIPPDTFGNRLILARAQAGHISIREAAELCGLGRGAWTNWEKGAQPEGYDALTDLISAKLGIDRDWLRNGGALRQVDDRRPRWRRNSSTSTVYPIHAPSRPLGRRPGSRPVTHRPPSGPGRTTRVHPPIVS